MKNVVDKQCHPILCKGCNEVNYPALKDAASCDLSTMLIWCHNLILMGRQPVVGTALHKPIYQNMWWMRTKMFLLVGLTVFLPQLKQWVFSPALIRIKHLNKQFEELEQQMNKKLKGNIT